MSRLDLAERHLAQVRSSAKIDHADRDRDDDDDERRIEKAELAWERRRQTLLLITGGPPLDGDMSVQKLNFLAAFGLTTTSDADGQYSNNYHNYNNNKLLLLLLPLHQFDGLFVRTTWVSRYQKGKTSMDLNEARHDGVLGCSGISWTIRKQSSRRSRQITTPTPHQSIFTGRMLFLTPNQQCQSIEGERSL